MDEGYYQCFAKNQYGTALSDMIHVQMRFVGPTAGPSLVLQKSVVEGMPFHIQAERSGSLPEPRYEWHIAAEDNARYTQVQYSKRIQMAENGDLHFAYAHLEDAPDGRIYRCSNSEKTQLTVTRNPSGNISQLAPTLAFSSEAQTVALVGESVTLRCFFYGYPEAMISWRGPMNTLPTERSWVEDFNTTLVLFQVVASDEGNYSCTASNTQGENRYTFQIRVQAGNRAVCPVTTPPCVNAVDIACYNGGICCLRNYIEQFCACPEQYDGDDCSIDFLFVMFEERETKTVCPERALPCRTRTELFCHNGGFCCQRPNMDKFCGCPYGYGGDDCSIEYMLPIFKEMEPICKNPKDGQSNVNVTEGQSITFSCNVIAKSRVNIVWLQNGQPIDTDNPPKRFTFSNDNRSLTIRDVCRDCVDRENKTDLMVIQCNASNVHGYAFAQGYLNVLMKTKVTIRGSKSASVDFLEEKQFVFQCIGTSDPSTPPTVRWYKTEPFGDLVRDEPPYIYVAKEFLIIMIDPKCSASNCSKYLGEYRCFGDNGYSQENRTITLSYKYRSSSESDSKKEEPCAVWKGFGAMGLVLLLIGIFLVFYSRRHFRTVNRRARDRKLPNTPSMYERVWYDSVDPPLQTEGNNGRSMRKAYIMYEHVGYDSIDQVLEDMAAREGAATHSAEVDGYNGYESIDAPQNEAKSTGRPMLDEDTMCGDMGYSIPLEEVTNGCEINQQQISGYESEQSESGQFPKSNEQSESTNTYSDLNREEVNDNMDLRNSNLNPTEMNPNLDLSTKEVNQCQDQSLKEVNQKMDVDPKEVNQYFYLGSEEVNPYTDTGSKELNQYSDLGPKEVNQYMELSPKEGNQYLDLDSKEVNQYLDLDSKEVNQYLDLDSKEVNQYLDLDSKEVNQYLDLDSKEVNQYLDLDSKEVNQYLDLSPTEVNQYLDLGPKEVNQYMGLSPKEGNQTLDLSPTDVNQ